MSQNLIVNGNFSQGNTGFSTSNHYVAPDPNYHTFYGDYSIIQNPGTQFQNGYDSYGDHTSGHGNMLFVDANDQGTYFWSETLTLAAHTKYSFTYFVTASDGSQEPTIQTLLNGNATGTAFAVTEEGGGDNWEKVTLTFKTGKAGAYDLALTDLNTSQGGNDFTVDDLKLVAKGGSSAHPFEAAAIHAFAHHDALALHPSEHLPIA